MSEFTDSVTAFHRWSKSIINSVVYGYSNGFTEGINNKIKVLKRNAYGFHNFTTFRKRILLSTVKITRQTAV